MFATFAPEHPTPTRSLVFAGFYFLIGIACLVGSIRSRWQVKWTGGTPASLFTQIAMILLFFIWGTCSIGDARGWSFFERHPIVWHLAPMAAVAVGLGFDTLRERLSRS